MGEHGAPAYAVFVAIRAGKLVAARDLGPELEKERRGRKPAQLDPVLPQCVCEERLVRQRRVLEIPGVLVDLVMVADAGEETPPFEGKSLRQCKRLEIGLFDLDLVVRRQRGNR